MTCDGLTDESNGYMLFKSSISGNNINYLYQWHISSGSFQANTTDISYTGILPSHTEDLPRYCNVYKVDGEWNADDCEMTLESYFGDDQDDI